ncbi:MAG: flagellar motor switch protein FliM, partial [Gammaproteobacteria bacterium]
MSNQFLSQDEVDALLDGVGDEPAPQEAVAPGAVREYDLARQERIVRGRMPTLELVHERFARNLRVGLFNFMRRNPDVSVGPVSVQKYSAFLRNIAVPTNINVVQVKPLRGSGLLICEPQLVFAIIDSLFGGNGRFQTRIEGRDFSATEQRIIERLVEVVCEEYRKAWATVYPLELEYTRSEMQPQFANIASPAEIVVTTSFAIEIGEAG